MILYRERKSFGRKIGRKLSVTKQNLIKDLLPQFSFNIKDLERYSLFKEIQCEIGFGSGERLYNQAVAHPDILFIGAEPFLNGVGELLKKIHLHSKPLSNIIIWPDDIKKLLSQLPDNFFDKFIILYPDPWPKRKHYARRIINDQTLNILSSKLKINGELLIATDHKDYGNWILLHICNNVNFQWVNPYKKDYFALPEKWIQTKYQEKSKSSNPHHLILCYKSVKNY